MIKKLYKSGMRYGFEVVHETLETIEDLTEEAIRSQMLRDYLMYIKSEIFYKIHQVLNSVEDVIT